MLVLARSTGQSVVLDGRIVITVLATRGGLVRLGIDAPADVGVRRAELVLLPEGGPDPGPDGAASARRGPDGCGDR